MQFLYFLIFVFISLPSLAQNCCTGGSPLANNLNLSKLDSGLSVQLVYDHNLMNDFVSRGTVLDDDSYLRYNISNFLQLSWAMNKKLSFGLMLNYSTHYLNRRTTISGRETKSSGLGDLVFTTNYNLFQKGKHNVQVGAGLILPTGRNDVKDVNFGILLPWDLQPGFGGWGGILMGQYQSGKIITDNLSYFGLLVYQYLFENQKPQTSQFFKQGSEYQFYQGIGYNLFLFDFLVVPQLGFRLKYTNQDQINGAIVESSGGFWLYHMLGLNVQLFQNLTLMAAYEAPVYRQLNGSQLTTSDRFRFGFNAIFGSKEKSPESTLNF